MSRHRLEPSWSVQCTSPERVVSTYNGAWIAPSFQAPASFYA